MTICRTPPSSVQNKSSTGSCLSADIEQNGTDAFSSQLISGDIEARTGFACKQLIFKGLRRI